MLQFEDANLVDVMAIKLSKLEWRRDVALAEWSLKQHPWNNRFLGCCTLPRDESFEEGEHTNINK